MFWDAEILIFLLYFTKNWLSKFPYKSPNSPKANKIPKFAFLGDSPSPELFSAPDLEYCVDLTRNNLHISVSLLMYI
jgi:hypothetical protein